MNFKKYNKYIIMVFIVLIAFIAIIIVASDLDMFSTKKSDIQKEKEKEPSVINIALIIDKSCSDTKVNLLTKSIEDICTEFDKTYNAFNVKDYNNSYEKTIAAATTAGAGLVICPDASFEETVYKLQSTYVGTTFLIIDGTPHNSDKSDTTVNFNVIPLTHDEADAGFLAGYAAVYGGYTNLAFMGLTDDSSSAHYCYGFLQGADYASGELNKTDIRVTYTYTTPDTARGTATSFYQDGVDLIIASTNSIIDEVLKASADVKRPVIACGDDYTANDNKYLIASTNKNTYVSTYDCLKNFYSNTITAGKTQKYSTSNNSITLDFNADDFQNFNSTIYDTLYQKLANDSIQIISDTTVPIEDLELANISPILKEEPANPTAPTASSIETK